MKDGTHEGKPKPETKEKHETVTMFQDVSRHIVRFHQ